MYTMTLYQVDGQTQCVFVEDQHEYSAIYMMSPDGSVKVASNLADINAEVWHDLDFAMALWSLLQTQQFDEIAQLQVDEIPQEIHEKFLGWWNA
jgi:hypothetical protein